MHNLKIKFYRVIPFIMVFALFFTVKPFAVQVFAAQDKGTVLINDDFESYEAGTDASKLGFDIETPGDGFGGSYVKEVPGSTNKALYFYDSVSSNLAGRNYTGLTKKFDSQKGIVTAEISYMQTGDQIDACNVMNILSSDNKVVARITTETDSDCITYKSKTAPQELVSFQTNKWYDIKVTVDMPNKKVSVYIDGVLLFSRQSIVEATAEDVGGIQFMTAGLSNNSVSEKYIDNIKVYGEKSFNAPDSPTGLAGFPRDGEVGLTWDQMAGADKYGIYASTTPGGPYTALKTYNKGNIPKAQYSFKFIGNTPVVNGTPYYVVVTQFSNVYDDKGNIVYKESGYSDEITVTPSVAIPVDSSSSNIISNVKSNDSYYGNTWIVNSNMQVGSKPYNDADSYITKLPDPYAGTDWIGISNYSSSYAGDILTTFTAKDDSDVYVAMDSRAIMSPTSWLADWTKTGDSIELDGGAVVLNIYKKSFKANADISLGSNGAFPLDSSGKSITCNSYIVLVKSQPMDIKLDSSSKLVNNPSYVVSGTLSNLDYLTIKLNGKTIIDSVDKTSDPSFSQDLNLTAGDNTIEIIGTRNGNFTLTKTLTVTYDNSNAVINIKSAPPVLTNDSSVVLDGSLNKDAYLTIKINGITILDSELKKANEEFSETLNLNKGMNFIEMRTKDLAGNESTISYKVNYSFRTEKVSFNDLNGVQISKLIPSQGNIASVQLTNKTDESMNDTLIFALYGYQNTMTNYSAVSVNLAAGETKTINTGLRIPSDSSYYAVKAFLWDNIEDMNDLSSIVVIKVR